MSKTASPFRQSRLRNHFTSISQTSHTSPKQNASVKFEGFKNQSELPAYYCAADAFVLPSGSETWGLVVNEAMACGLPVICTDVAGCAADLVRTNGRLVAVRNVEQLTEKMSEIAGNPGLRQLMARESARLIRNYSPELCAAGIAKAAAAEAVAVNV